MNAIPKRKFGQTGLEVTILGLGGVQVGNSQVSEKEAERFLNSVLDAGINLIDTARGYGLSEERIGKYLSNRRDEFILSTKVGYDVEGYSDWTKETVTAGIDRALRLLRTDMLDIVHLHSCELETLQNGGVLEALDQAHKAGKVRVAAYSGENEALDFAISSGLIQSIQLSVNPCDQGCIDKGLARATEANLGVIAKRPVANIFWRFSEQPTGNYAEEYWVRARAMQLDPGKLSWQEFTLRFATYTPGVHTSIVGTSSLKHLHENIDAVAKGPLPPEIYASTRATYKKHDQNWTVQV